MKFAAGMIAGLMAIGVFAYIYVVSIEAQSARPSVQHSQGSGIPVMSNAQAEPLVNIGAGSVIECAPFPSIKTLNEQTVFQNGKLALGSQVSCVVTKAQAVPMTSKFVGQLVDGPVPNSYAFQWEVLQVPGGYSVRWNNAGRDQPSSIQGEDGHLRLTFKHGLVADLATGVN